MPKLDITHKISRIQERIAQLERGEALEARDINALLTKEQQHKLKQLWAVQQALRKTHKSKAAADADGLVWKTIREVRLDVYRQAFAEIQNELVDGMTELAARTEIRAAKVFMDAWASADKDNKDGWVQGNIALRRAGFNRLDQRTSRRDSKRDAEVREMEDALRSKLKD